MHCNELKKHSISSVVLVLGCSEGMLCFTLNYLLQSRESMFAARAINDSLLKRQYVSTEKHTKLEITIIVLLDISTDN